MTNLVIAIDGPSGSGKSSTSKALAKKLGMAYLDTGSMYRAFAWYCLDREVDAEDVNQVKQAIQEFKLEILPDPNQFIVCVNCTEITSELHTPRISGAVSAFAAIQQVRDFLIEQMRLIISQHRPIVVEGRDITTVVAPDAQVKVLLTADPKIRVARRSRQLAASDKTQITEQVIGRDLKDAKVNNFSTPAQGVVLIDNSVLTMDQVVDQIIALIPANNR